MFLDTTEGLSSKVVLTVRESGAGDPVGEVGTPSRAEPFVQGNKTTVNASFEALGFLTIDFSLVTYRLLLLAKQFYLK